MSHWYLSDPAYATHLDRARQARAEALARAAYLAIDGVARLAGAAGTAVAAATRSATDAVRRWRRRRAALYALMALDDRTLNDIGLSRAEIPRVVDDLLRSPARDRAPVPAETGAVKAAEFRPDLAA
ncbi:MAG TPA: DUF1127 domain-containing protein [Dongiaceae bacterium]|nr:DUF1127 domain-containing protein [Dongiaceae bacterium]